jgi:glyoxylase-like metal-dependent hydrolase (beta-lactamase superfamily II)
MCQTNCYFLYREDAKECILIDPADQGQQIYNALSKNGFTIQAILLTHGHFDHIWGANEVRSLAGVKMYAYEQEKELLNSEKLNVSKGAGRPYTVEADVYLKDGETLTVADMTCKCIATPGHTAGSCCYYFEDAGILVSGDTLFQESVGRTDLPTGNMRTLMNSVKQKLFVLPEETKVYPGHGESTNIGYEKKYNPFI